MILLTGATGTVGRQVVALLAGKGIKHRALVRDLSKAGPITNQFTEIIGGDLGKPKSLGKALRDIDTVFLLTPLSEQQLELEGNLVKAAKRAKVKRIVKLSVIGAEEHALTIMRIHRESEQNIIKSGIPYTFIRPNFFMQNLVWYVPTIRDQGAFYSPLATGKISMVDVRDVAEVVVKALTEPGEDSAIYNLTGPEALSFGEVAGILSRVSGREVKFIPVTNDQARTAMLGGGMSLFRADAMINLLDGFANGYGAPVTTTIKDVLGHEPRRLEDFALDLKSFLAKAA
jgi:uncharacterized protein YbjT (DUF2867 family)